MTGVSEWHQQWSMFEDHEKRLFEEWLAPVALDSLRGLDVLECGCGGGQHTAMVAEVARSVTAVDLNTIDIARRRNKNAKNVTFVEADLGDLDLGRQFDFVFCVGVIHHTDDPDRTFDRIFAHCKSGGRLLIWTYSAEGNGLVRFVVEPIRKLFLRHLPRRSLVRLAWVLTIALYPFVYTIYLLPFMTFLPYYEYFKRFRRLSPARNVLNVFDKLNAPQTRFTSRATCERWFSPDRFEPQSIVIRPHAGVSYTLTGVRRLG